MITRQDISFSYGPVPSRRLGKSLGINNIPAKVCTYACAYCQVGRTTQKLDEPRSFYDPETIFRDARDRLLKAKAKAEQVDYLAFVPDGEPTLDMNLDREIVLLKTLGVPVGAITNSSLLCRADVQSALREADWVSLKIDAIREKTWRRINRPHKDLRLSRILDGILAFVENFTGKLVTETMLVAGLNDDDACLKEIAGFLHAVKPSAAYLGIPIRPPAEKWVHAPDEATLNRAYRFFSDQVKNVEYLTGYEGNTFVFTDDIEKALLGIIAVHPMRKDAVDLFLSRAGSSWKVVDRLLAEGRVAETNYNGHFFYLRKSKKRRPAT